MADFSFFLYKCELWLFKIFVIFKLNHTTQCSEIQAAQCIQLLVIYVKNLPISSYAKITMCWTLFEIDAIANCQMKSLSK